jgi:hypothetical protein
MTTEEGTSIPEPASFLLIGGGLLAIGILGMRALRAQRSQPRL